MANNNETTADIVNEIGIALDTKCHFDRTLYRWARPNTNKIVSGGMAPSYFVDDVRLIDLYFRLKRSLKKDKSRSKKAENALNEIVKILDREHTELVTDYRDVVNIIRKYRAKGGAKTKPIRNCDRFETAEDAYNACPQFCDIDVKTMTERELKIIEATTKCLEWLFAPIAEKGVAK